MSTPDRGGRHRLPLPRRGLARASCGRTCSPAAGPSAGCPTSGCALEDYYSPDPAAPDRFYTAKAAVIEGFEFDRVKLPGRRQHLPLHRPDALAGAGHRRPGAGRRRLPRAARACRRATPAWSIGNTPDRRVQPGQPHAAALAVRPPHGRRRAARAGLGRRGAGRVPRRARGRATRARSRRSTRTPWPAAWPTPSPAGSATTSTSRAAATPSTAPARPRCCRWPPRCNALADGQLDVAIAGGVDLSIDPFEVIGFAKTGALATGEMRVYDRHSNGFWPGEGCGMLVLMREEDAHRAGPAPLRHHRRLGLLLRRQGRHHPAGGAGHRLAIERAYRSGRLRHRDRRLPRGPRHRHRGRRRHRAAGVLRAPGARPTRTRAPAAISTMKGNIGHTKAAAGVGRADQGDPGRAPPGDPAGHRPRTTRTRS